MTENKRFYLDENGINDREYEFNILGEDELLDIINNIEKENKELKAENERLKKAWKYNCEICCEKCKKFRQYEVKTECEDFELDLEKVLK